MSGMSQYTEDALDSSKWGAKKTREYNQEVADAYADGYASGKDVACGNAGSLTTKQGSETNCPCRGCNGARAAAAKQTLLTGQDVLKPQT